MYAEDFKSCSPQTSGSQDLNPHIILNQSEYLNEIRTILTHPFFTGQCPNCGKGLTISNRVLGKSRCRSCGWREDG